MNNKKLLFAAITVILAAAAFIFLSPAYVSCGTDCMYPPFRFSMGGYTMQGDEKEYAVSQNFTAASGFFKGAELFLTDVCPDDTGYITAALLDGSKILCEKEIPVQELTDYTWNRIDMPARRLAPGKEYSLRVTVNSSTGVLRLCTVTGGTDTAENTLCSVNGIQTEGGLLVSYIYEDKEKTFHMRVIAGLSAAAAEGLAVCLLITGRKKTVLKRICICCLMWIVMSENFLFNTLCPANKSFDTFQQDSDELIIGALAAEKDGVPTYGYNIGRYRNAAGLIATVSDYRDMENALLCSDRYKRGYSSDGNTVAYSSNFIIEKLNLVGKQARFPDGSVYTVTDTVSDGAFVHITFDAGGSLSEERNGSLAHIRFYNGDGSELFVYGYENYRTQPGLQGFIYRKLSHNISLPDAVKYYKLACVLLTAAVFMLIVLALDKKYGRLMAGCFYAVFLLSPWTVNFARILYWVEFTWFMPMLTGLFLVLYPDSRKVRITVCIGAFVTVFVRCLCGYEYISAFMVGMMVFPFAEFVGVCAERDRKRAVMYLRTMFIMGAGALAAFGAAMAIHGSIRGSGDIAAGISDIIKNDAQRRMWGNETFIQDKADYYNVSVWKVIDTYRLMPGEIVTGIKGVLLPVLSVVPAVIFAWDAVRHRKAEPRIITAYAVSLAAPLSWFVLGKSHSVIHIHLNYVLWYMGFVQICFYVCADKIRVCVESVRKK